MISNLIFLLLFKTFIVQAIMFHGVPNGQKCLREEVRQNVLIVGEIEVEQQPNQKVDYVVSKTRK